MRSYLALIRIDLKLALRNRSVLFFNYLFPLIFLFAFAELLDAALISHVVSMVLVLGILGNGLFGAGMRAVHEREANILRRFKVAPIGPLPLLTASLVTGWLVYLPTVILIMGLAHLVYGMPVPERLISLVGLISIGVFSFRALGLILASVANSMQESNILIQLLYMPMLFLSGATFPLHMLPGWAQITAQFLPASYLVVGFQGVFLRNESFLDNWFSAAALLITTLLSLFISIQLFRWEKEERIRPAAKLWVLGVLLPFVLLGAYQAGTGNYRQSPLESPLVEAAQVQRILIQDARIFVGDGQVIESGSVLLEDKKIARVVKSPATIEVTEGTLVLDGGGRTLLPGLIDVHVHLGSPSKILKTLTEPLQPPDLRSILSALLYSGVTTVKTVGESVSGLRRHLESAAQGLPGPEVIFTGPLIGLLAGTADFTDEVLDLHFPEALERSVPASIEGAKDQIRRLQESGSECVQTLLDGDGRLQTTDLALLKAIIQNARQLQLPVVVHAGSDTLISAAVRAGADGVEQRFYREDISDLTFLEMTRRGASYTPMLTLLQSMAALQDARTDFFSGSLAEQILPPPVILRLTERIKGREFASSVGPVQDLSRRLRQAEEHLRHAYLSGVTLVAGSGSGNSLLVHGSSLHQELRLWRQSGVPAAVALQAATYNAARLLRMSHRVGTIAEGFDANLLLVDGNPLDDIRATERVAEVIFHGKRVERESLFSLP